MDTLDLLREKIDKIDSDIIKKLSARQKLSKKIGKLKSKSGQRVRDLAREQQQKTQYEELCLTHGLDFIFINSLFEKIIAHSRKIQKNG